MKARPLPVAGLPAALYTFGAFTIALSSLYAQTLLILILGAALGFLLVGISTGKEVKIRGSTAILEYAGLRVEVKDSRIVKAYKPILLYRDWTWYTLTASLLVLAVSIEGLSSTGSAVEAFFLGTAAGLAAYEVTSIVSPPKSRSHVLLAAAGVAIALAIMLSASPIAQVFSIAFALAAAVNAFKSFGTPVLLRVASDNGKPFYIEASWKGL